MLVGQERAEAILSRALQQGRVSHAYLFVGPDAVGKTTAAILFAQALNCERLGDLCGVRLAPCGTCDSCRRIAAGTHPDVHVIIPGSKSGQNISVEQVRDVRQDVARRPIMGRRKLYLMPAAEAMNEEAANTLLKTLEEPPEYVTLLLMAASPTRVLPTVLSRCQVVPFGLAPAGVIRDWLEANGVAAEAAGALAISAAGRPGLAMRWSREPEILEQRRLVLQLLKETARLRQRARQNPGESIAALRLAERARALAGSAENGTRRSGVQGAPPRSGGPGRSAGTVKAEPDADGVAPEGLNARTPEGLISAKPAFTSLLELVRGFYRDLLLLAQGAPDSLVRNADELSALRASVEWYTPVELLAALEAVNRSQQFIDRNVAPQLVLETLFLDLLQPEECTATGTAPARY